MADPEARDLALPRAPIDRLIGPLERFLHIEAASGVFLLVCTVAALALANSPASASFLAFWETPISFGIGSFEQSHSLRHWINDGLMALFFFVIGLEVKRELAIGELRDLRRAALPIIAAIGGIVVPAGIYLALQLGEPGERGWGIAMATDIAFVVGCLALLGSRIPRSLRVLLVSLAIADDIAAILVIAVGYTESINATALLLSALGVGVVVVLQRLGVRSILMYSLLGVGIWYACHESGVHATLAGVVLGLLTPARAHLSDTAFAHGVERVAELARGEWADDAPGVAAIRRIRRASRESVSPVEYLETLLHPWVGFVIMPIFAFANAGVPFQASYLQHPIAIAVTAGLVVGKPLGILSFSYVGVRIGLVALPEDLNWGMLLGGGALAGIGFTMALFIAGLALPAGSPLDAAKVGVLVASAISAAIGMTVLLRTTRPPSTT